MSSTKYTVTTFNAATSAFEATDFTRSTKKTVVAEAERVNREDKIAVQVVTGTGTVVFEAKRPPLRIITKHTAPFTRVEELPEELRKLVPAGYVAAYRRSRNGAIVLRNESAEDEERYMVISETETEALGFAPTTRAAGAIMAEAGRKRAKTQAEARAAADDAKAAEKALADAVPAE